MWQSIVEVEPVVDTVEADHVLVAVDDRELFLIFVAIMVLAMSTMGLTVVRSVTVAFLLVIPSELLRLR